MRYRRLDANGDRVFGHGASDFFKDVPAAPAQAAETRLGLFLGEFFTNTEDGTDWKSKILGTGTQGSYDLELRTRILGTPEVTGIESYASNRDRDLRILSVTVGVATSYGIASVVVDLPVAAPSVPITRQPVQLTTGDGSLLIGQDGAYLFDPRLPLT